MTEGLKRERTIYVRCPEAGGKNADMLLIQKGAQAVASDGTFLSGKDGQPAIVAEDPPVCPKIPGELSVC